MLRRVGIRRRSVLSLLHVGRGTVHPWCGPQTPMVGGCLEHSKGRCLGSQARCPICELSTPAQEYGPCQRHFSGTPLRHILDTRMPVGPKVFLGYERLILLKSSKYLSICPIIRHLEGYQLVAICCWDWKVHHDLSRCKGGKTMQSTMINWRILKANISLFVFIYFYFIYLFFFFTTS